MYFSFQLSDGIRPALAGLFHGLYFLVNTFFMSTCLPALPTVVRPTHPKFVRVKNKLLLFAPPG